MSDDKTEQDGVRVIPDQWLEPLPVGEWFDAAQPLEVDLGCGKGRFLLARAARCPEVNFLGIERLLGRVNRVGRRAGRQALGNVRLLRMEGNYALKYLMPRNQVRTYYIFFPDPWPKKKHHGHRIISPDLMTALYDTLAPGGVVHFATDHLPYFYEAVQVIQADSRFGAVEPFQPSPEERTDFELMFLGEKPIGRYSFCKRSG